MTCDRHKNDIGKGHQPGHPGYENGRGHHKDCADTFLFAITDDVDDAGSVIDLPGIDVYSLEENPWFGVIGGDLVLTVDILPGDDPAPVLAETSVGTLWLDAYDVSGG